MAYDIGPRIGIDGEAEFRRAINNINTNIKTLGTEMLAVTSAYEANDKSAAALTARNEVLVKQIDAQKEKLAKLQEGLAASAEKYGDNHENTLRWQQTVNKATADLNNMERQLAENSRELDRNTEEVRENNDELKNQDSALDGIGSKLKMVGSGFAAAAKAAAAGVVAASAAVGALVKSSIEGYAECEQLVGGVETLFQSSSDKVVRYANDAYKTAGLSANEYMETVTGFSASLLQSLNGDTAKAAEVANQAIVDMSDNANKMGSDMESIQNAYQGFAKQNYTMLDNLKLGYGGTKEEMQRLLSDAEKLSGQKFDLSSYSDIIEAIHVVQTEMGITGTTAKEASTTIQGSIGAMKSAWENLVTGLAGDSSSLDQLIGNFVDSVATAGENVLPRIETALSGIGQMISQLAPSVTAEVPALITGVLPSMLEAGAQLLGGLVTGLVSAVPALASSLVQVVETLSSNFQESAPLIGAAGAELLSFIGKGIMNGLPLLAEGAVSIMTGLGKYLQENLPILIQSGLETLSSFTGSLRENAGLVVDGAIELAKSLAQGLADSIPTIIENVPTIVSNIANTINDNAPKVLKAGVEIIGSLVMGLIDVIPTIIENMPRIIAAVRDTIMAVNWVNLGGSIIKGLGSGIKGMVQTAKNAIDTIKDALKDGVKTLPEMFKKIGKDIVDGVWNGIKSMGSWIKEKVSSFFTDIVDGVKGVLGIHSPSKVFAGIGGYMAEGLGQGFGDEIGTVQRSIQRSMAELAGNASATVRVSGNIAGSQEVGVNSILAELPALIAEAAHKEFEGMGVYLNLRKVGEMTNQWQANNARAMGI